MKKLKLLPSILMLVLCVGVLAVGVFAITPTENQITGSITVNASNVPVKLEFFLDDDETNKITHEEVRGGEDFKFSDILGEDGVFEYDLSSANKIWEVPVKKMTIRVTNLSETEQVGAYYLREEFSATSLIDPYHTLYSADGSVRVAEVTMPSYTIIDAGESADMWIEFSLPNWVENATSAEIDYYLYCEKYADNIETKYEQTTNSIICSEGTDGIVNAVVPEGVTSLGDESFGYYSTLKTLVLPSTLQSFSHDVVIESSLVNLSFPKAFDGLNDCSICDCSTLEYIDLGRSVGIQLWMESLIYSLPNLKHIVFNDSVKYLDNFLSYVGKTSGGGMPLLETIEIVPTATVFSETTVPTLTQDGKTFDGWYVTEEDGTETKVTSITDRDYRAVYTAKWELND